MSSSSNPPPGKQEQIHGKDKQPTTTKNKRPEAEKSKNEAEKSKNDVLKDCIALWKDSDDSTSINVVSPEVAAMNAKIERAIYGTSKGKKRLPVFEAICPSEDKDKDKD